MQAHDPRLGDRYADLIRGSAGAFREAPLFDDLPPRFSEIELQTRWFAGEFGRRFGTIDGQEVEIVQFGVWNRGAGPDFREVVARIDGATVKGDLELDTGALDWEHHQHAINPDYDKVVLHVFFSSPASRAFTRTSRHRLVPQVRLDPPEDPFNRPPDDLPLARPGRCAPVLAGFSESGLARLLACAARHRLQRKAGRLKRISEIHGRQECLYQSIAVTLGYRQNKLPFTVLAQRLPLAALRARPESIESILLGAAGFLDNRTFDSAGGETRAYLAALWENWWKRRPEFEFGPRQGGVEWNLAGIRPANHPQRRLAALATVANNWNRFQKHLDPRSWNRNAFLAFLQDLSHPFWDTHYTLTSKPARKPMALIGRSRAIDFLVNHAFPPLLDDRPELWDDFLSLPAPQVSRAAATAAARLLPDHPLAAGLLKKSYAAQGLLQIYEDFCLRDHSDCVQCPFPEQVAAW